MTHTKSREIRLKNRPEGLPRATDFELTEVTLTEPAEGEILVQNIYMSVDPYMRGRMYDRESYIPPFQIGKPLEGGCIGRVIESKNGLIGKRLQQCTTFGTYIRQNDDLSGINEIQIIDPGIIQLE